MSIQTISKILGNNNLQTIETRQNIGKLTSCAKMDELDSVELCCEEEISSDEEHELSMTCSSSSLLIGWWVVGFSRCRIRFMFVPRLDP